MADKKTKMGRKLLDIDPDDVFRLASMQCTNKEIGAFFGCDETTIAKRFSTELSKGRETGKMSLRRKQLEVAKSGNVTMLIWLGKQYLGQSDKQEVGGAGGGPLHIKVTIDDS